MDDMQNQKKPQDHGYKAHLFICTKQKDSSECCSAKGSTELFLQLKEKSRQRWGKSLRVNAAGCLGYCSEGITAVLYPHNRWFTGLTSDSLQQLEEMLEQAMGPT